MRAPHLAILLGLVLATLAHPVESLGQTPSASKPSPPEDAARLYQEGNDLYNKRDFAGAEAKFLQAWATTKTFDVAANLGIVELELKKYREAATHLAFSLRNAPPSTKPAQRDNTRQALEEAKKQVCTLRLSVSPSGASVAVDAEAIATELMGAELFVLPGERTITATLEGHEPASRTVDATPGGALDLVLTLKEKPKAAPKGVPTVTGTAAVPAARSAIPVFALGGGALAALGVGIGLDVAAASDDGNVKRTSEDILSKKGSCVPGASNFDPRCPALESQARNAQTMSGVGVGLMVGAGILAAGTVLYWLLPGAAPVKLGAAVAPDNGRAAGAVSVSGRF